MMISIRWFSAMGLACITTLLLFYFMQALLATSQEMDVRLNIIKIIDASMPKFEQEILKEIEPPELIEQLPEPPPDIRDKSTNMDPGPDLYISKEVAVIDTTIDLGNATIGITDGKMLPLINVKPQYPQRALQRGIEGWCIVHFTVSATGNVIEDSIVVVDVEPANVFDRACRRAAIKFRFQPRVEGGKGVEVAKVPYLFRFEIQGQ